MKYRSIRLMISLVTFLTLCLVLPSGSVRAEGEEGEEYLCVTAEVRDIGGELPEDASFLITFAPKDEADTVSPLPDKPQTMMTYPTRGILDCFLREQAKHFPIGRWDCWDWPRFLARGASVAA